MESLVILNGNRESNKRLFLVSLVIGLLVLMILAATLGYYWWAGLVVFAFVESLLGIPSLIGWRRAEAKIAAIRAAIDEIDRASGG